MIAASASPGREEKGHLSPSKAAGLLHDSSCLKQLRDQSPKTHGNLVQPVVSFSGHGAVITTAGPVLSPGSPLAGQQAPMSYLAALAAPRQVLTTAVGASPGTGAAPIDEQQQQQQQHIQHRAGSPGAMPAAAGAGAGAAAAAGGKRAAALIRGQLESNNSFTAAQRAPKHQVLDHSAVSASLEPAGPEPEQPQQQQQWHSQQQQQQQESADSDTLMSDAVDQEQHPDTNHHHQQQQPQQPEQAAAMQPDHHQQQQGQAEVEQSVLLHGRSSLPTPFCSVGADIAPFSSSPDRELDSNQAAAGFNSTGSGGSPTIQQQQQQRQQLPPSGLGRSGSSSRMPPPSGAPARRLLPRGDSPSSSTGSPTAAAAVAAAAALSGGSPRRSSLDEAAAAAGPACGLDPTVKEPSLSVDNILACRAAAISSAASLEGWLPNSAIAAAVAAAVAENQAAGGSPRAAAAAAAAAANSLLRSGSTASVGSLGRQGSLVFPLPAVQSAAAAAAAAAAQGQQQQQQQGGSSSGRPISATGLESAGSFAGWPGGAAAAAAAGVQGSGGGLYHEGSFSWPKVAAAAAKDVARQDSLQLDIQVLAPVIPEEYPEEDPAEQASPLAQQQAAMLAQMQAAREAQQHVDRAFFAKVAAWEAELVGMLEQQAAPLAIRQIVSVFKDRINSERDKTEFKAICDKWTSVVEYPVGSGVKCLAIKSWMRGQL